MRNKIIVRRRRFKMVVAMVQIFLYRHGLLLWTE